MRVYSGILIASNWDDCGAVTEVKFCTRGEKEYLVDMNSVGIPLQPFLAKAVKVEGFIKREGKGKSSIVLKNIKEKQR